MFTDDRKQTRRVFFVVWEKYQEKKPLDTLESQLLNVIIMHPEYQTLLSKPDIYLDHDYPPETHAANPFMHMGMHLAIQDQVRLNKPVGMKQIFRDLSTHLSGDTHETEHRMASCLMEILFDLRDSDKAFNEKRYLKKLKKLLRL